VLRAWTQTSVLSSINSGSANHLVFNEAERPARRFVLRALRTIQVSESCGSSGTSVPANDTEMRTIRLTRNVKYWSCDSVPDIAAEHVRVARKLQWLVHQQTAGENNQKILDSLLSDSLLLKFMGCRYGCTSYLAWAYSSKLRRTFYIRRRRV